MYKDWPKRIHIPNATYFVTTATKDRIEYFKSETLAELFVKELSFCKRLKRFELYAFIILPDHIHLLIKPGKANISEIMRSLKANFSRNVNKMFSVGAVTSPHLQRDDKNKLTSPHLRNGNNGRELTSQHLLVNGFYWQKSFHDHYIRNKRDFDNHFKYTIYNYIHHGIDDECKFTSLNYPDLIDEFE